MTWTEDDPSHGDTATVQGLATLRAMRAGRIRGAQDVLRTTSTQSGVDWEAETQRSFAATLAEHSADIELLATGLEAQQTALTTYAGALAQLQDRQLVLQARRDAAEQALAVARSAMPLPRLVPDAPPTMPGMGSAATADADADLRRQQAAAQTQIDSAQAALRAIDVEWKVLVSDRRRIDATCAAALQGETVLGPISGFSGGSIAASAPSSLLDQLDDLSATDLAILLDTYPGLAAKLESADPETVSAWWQALSSEQQHAFVTGIPFVIGALAGVPALARVTSNKINAERALRDAQRALADVRSRRADGVRFPPGTEGALERQIAYLRLATGAHPSVQLYLYRPEDDRIIEMVGTPSAATEKVVTYSPGTYANLDGFYDRSIPRVARWMYDQDRSGVVAFVYKDGRYPQDVLTEANDPDYVRPTGAQLAAFQANLATDPLLRGRESIAIGHSWGVANITASEVAGARYDSVISLSGAGVPAEWRPASGTRYRDFSYNDILQKAQAIRTADGGAVWDGRNPRWVGFDHDDYFVAPPSWKNFPGNGLVNPMLPALAGVDSHNLAATDDSDNRYLLYRMRKYINDASVQ